MLSLLKLALVSAIPVEVINFWAVGYPANPSSVSHASQFPAVALQWYLFHLPGIVASDRSLFLREHARLDSLVLFCSGYIVTAVFFALMLWMVHMALPCLHKLSSPLRHSH